MIPKIGYEIFCRAHKKKKKKTMNDAWKLDQRRGVICRPMDPDITKHAGPAHRAAGYRWRLHVWQQEYDNAGKHRDYDRLRLLREYLKMLPTLFGLSPFAPEEKKP